MPHVHPGEIKTNLISQLTAPVLWKHSIENMWADGAREFVELGPGSVLQNLIKKIVPESITDGCQ